MKTIIDAVNVLKCDLKNSFEPRNTDKYLFYCNTKKHYVCLATVDSYGDRQYICTVDEFNAKVELLACSLQTYDEYKEEYDAVKPLPTPIKFEDGKPYQFDAGSFTWVGFYRKDGKFYDTKQFGDEIAIADYCTNITPLVPEVK